MTRVSALLAGWRKRHQDFTDKKSRRGLATPPKANSGRRLESELNRKLGLQRITYALAQEAVEIEQPRRDQRVDVVLVVKAVEHLNHWGERVTVAKVDWPERTPIKGEEAVVFAKVIAAAINAVDHPGKRIVGAAGSAAPGSQGIVGNWLRSVSLDARVELKTGRQFAGGIKVEFVTAVAVRKSVVFAEIEAIEVAEGEWVTFVGIIIHVFRQHVIPFHLETATEALTHSYCHASIQ